MKQHRPEQNAEASAKSVAAAAEMSRHFHESLRNNGHDHRSSPRLQLLFWRQAKTGTGQRTLRLVWGVLACQVLIAALIIAHEVGEVQGFRHVLGDAFAGGLALLLLGTVILSGYAVSVLIGEIRGADAARAVAQGAMARLVDAHFDEWKLTAAERDVALFTLKGFETQEIADLRHTAQGTVRVQLASVYGKAGVHTRCAFQSMFFEDLVDLPAAETADA